MQVLGGLEPMETVATRNDATDDATFAVRAAGTPPP